MFCDVFSVEVLYYCKFRTITFLFDKKKWSKILNTGDELSCFLTFGGPLKSYESQDNKDSRAQEGDESLVFDEVVNDDNSVVSLEKIFICHSAGLYFLHLLSSVPLPFSRL